MSQFFDEWQFEVQGHGVIPTAQVNYVHENNCCWGAVDSRRRSLRSIPSEFPSKFPRTPFALKWTNEKCRLLLWLRGGFLVDHTAPKKVCGCMICISWIQQTFFA